MYSISCWIRIQTEPKCIPLRLKVAVPVPVLQHREQKTTTKFCKVDNVSFSVWTNLQLWLNFNKIFRMLHLLTWDVTSLCRRCPPPSPLVSTNQEWACPCTPLLPLTGVIVPPAAVVAAPAAAAVRQFSSWRGMRAALGQNAGTSAASRRISASRPQRPVMAGLWIFKLWIILHNLC